MPIKDKLLVTRPQFLTTSVLPVLVGNLAGYHITGSLQYPPLIIALTAIACVHLAVNIVNDVYDDMNGTDKVNSRAIFPFTGGSQAIQRGLMTRQQMQHLGLIFLALSIMFGCILYFIKGPVVIFIGLLGIAMGISYSMPPLALASRGLGEVAIWFAMGPLPVLGGAWLQTGSLESAVIPVAIAVGLWVMNIILINEVPDQQADAVSGKRTLVVRLGNKAVAILYLLSSMTALVCLIMALQYNGISLWVLIVPTLLSFSALYPAYTIQQYNSQPELLCNAIRLSIATHTVNCIWLSVWFVA